MDSSHALLVAKSFLKIVCLLSKVATPRQMTNRSASRRT